MSDIYINVSRSIDVLGKLWSCNNKWMDFEQHLKCPNEKTLVYGNGNHYLAVHVRERYMITSY